MKSQTLIVIVIFLVGIFGYNSFFIIDQTQQVIITQFGKPIGKSIKDAGLHFKLPYQTVTYFENRILKLDGEPNEIPSNDKTFIWVDTTARWRIVDPLLFLQRLNNETGAKLILNNLIDGVVRDIVTKNNLIEIILSSDWKKEYSVSTEGTQQEDYKIQVGRDRFSKLVVERLRIEMEKNGIELLDVFIKRLNYTEKVRSKVYDRMISERKRIAAELRSEGEGEKAAILGKMEKNLSEIRSQAFKEAEIIKGNADSTALNIYGQTYSQDKDFYEFYITLDNYKKIVGKNTRLVIDSNSKLYKYFNTVE